MNEKKEESEGEDALNKRISYIVNGFFSFCGKHRFK